MPGDAFAVCDAPAGFDSANTIFVTDSRITDENPGLMQQYGQLIQSLLNVSTPDDYVYPVLPVSNKPQINVTPQNHALANGQITGDYGPFDTQRQQMPVQVLIVPSDRTANVIHGGYDPKSEQLLLRQLHQTPDDMLVYQRNVEASRTPTNTLIALANQATVAKEQIEHEYQDRLARNESDTIEQVKSNKNIVKSFMIAGMVTGSVVDLVLQIPMVGTLLGASAGMITGSALLPDLPAKPAIDSKKMEIQDQNLASIHTATQLNVGKTTALSAPESARALEKITQVPIDADKLNLALTGYHLPKKP